jgi:hypothetical protein
VRQWIAFVSFRLVLFQTILFCHSRRRRASRTNKTNRIVRMYSQVRR